MSHLWVGESRTHLGCTMKKCEASLTDTQLHTIDPRLHTVGQLTPGTLHTSYTPNESHSFSLGCISGAKEKRFQI